MSHDLGSSDTGAAWWDLSDNEPGYAGRERAESLRTQRRALPLFKRLTADREEERQWRAVADGKTQVARGFERLGLAWHSLHAIPGTEGGEIDHLLIGPAGVFTVNSSLHADSAVCLGADTMIVNGERVHHVQHSRLEAAHASRVLSEAVGFQVPVTGLVVIIGDNRFDVRQQPSDGLVHVSTPRAAVRWLRRLDREWTAYGVSRIYEFARRSSVWATPPAVAPEPVREEPLSHDDSDGDLEVRAAS